MVPQTLREHQLYAKRSKCGFYKRKVQYLGHIISEKGVVVDPAMFKDIVEWHVPKDVHDQIIHGINKVLSYIYR